MSSKPDQTLSMAIGQLGSEWDGFSLLLCDAIIEQMTSRNISYRHLAKISGLSYGKLRYHLDAKSVSSLYELLRVAQCLGIKGSLTLTLKDAASLDIDPSE